MKRSTVSWYAGSMRLCLAIAIAIAIVVLVPSPRPVAASEAMTEPKVVQLTREALRTYERMDWDKWVLMFAEDGMLHSVMRDPFVGREALKKRMIEFHHGIGMEPGSISLNIRNIGAVGDDVVMVERLDVWYQNGTKRQVPVVGVLVFDDDGLIKVWREYYDLATLKEQMRP